MKMIRSTVILLAVFNSMLNADLASAHEEYQITGQSYREGMAIGRRGFHWLEDAFKYQSLVWQAYFSWQNITMHGSDGRISDENAAELKTIDKHIDDLEKRRYKVHSLVFHLEGSPAALALDEKGAKVFWTLLDKWGAVTSIPYEKRTGPPMTKDELIALDKELDGFIMEMEKLPKLSPAKAKREFDATPEN